MRLFSTKKHVEIRDLIDAIRRNHNLKGFERWRDISNIVIPDLKRNGQFFDTQQGQFFFDKDLQRTFPLSKDVALSAIIAERYAINPIYGGFIQKGIPESEIKPRENVFTYNAWRALGRQVRRGEHGVKVLTFVDCQKKDEHTGQLKERFRRPWHTTVFHVSQTEPIPGGAQ